MRYRIPYILFLLIILSSCNYINTKSTFSTPTPQQTRAATIHVAKLIVSPDTGFYLDCTHITQTFSLANRGDLPLTWITTLLPGNGAAPITGVTIKPANGTLPSGGTITVKMQGKANMSFILRFIYKESDKHFIGVGQGVSCKS